MQIQVVNYGNEIHPCIALNYNYTLPTDIQNEALRVIQIGYSKHPPLRTEILCRDTYTLHYVKTGENTVNAVKMTAGDGYFMAPNENNIIKYPQENTAEIYWIMFTGYKASSFIAECGIAEHNHYYKLKQNSAVISLIQKALENDYNSKDISFSLLSLLYEIGSFHKSENNSKKWVKPKNIIVDNAINYIIQNYAHIKRVDEISSFVGVSQNHLCKLFKNALNCSIKDYLDDKRVAVAKNLLENTNMNISEISACVGFDDSMYFSQVFKKRVGLPPRNYRNSNIN